MPRFELQMFAGTTSSLLSYNCYSGAAAFKRNEWDLKLHSKPFDDLCVQREPEVGSDCVAEVSSRHTQSSLFMTGGSSVHCIMSQDVRLLQTDVQSKMRIVLKEAVRQDWSSFRVWIATRGDRGWLTSFAPKVRFSKNCIIFGNYHSMHTF